MGGSEITRNCFRNYSPRNCPAVEKTVIERQIAATDRQIDRLVYELYGLTDEEIAVVEESAG